MTTTARRHLRWASALLCAGLAPAACAPHVPGPAGPERLPVEVVSIDAPSPVDVLTASGIVHRERESELGFRAGGVLTRLAVDAGDRFSRGQVLGDLDATALRARLAQAAADLERARRDAQRYEALAANGFISGRQQEDQRTAVAEATAAYEAAAFEMRGARLVAPVSGVVLARRAQTGEVVQPGQPVLLAADAGSAFVLRLPVADRDISRLRPGAAAQVQLDGVPGQVLPGRISRIGAEADVRSGTVTVDIRLPDTAALRTGLVGRARIAVPTPHAQAAAARVPAEAVLEARDGRAVVYRIDAQGVARRTSVTFAGFDGDDALLVGLPAGARVITTGAGFVNDGQAVTWGGRAQATGPGRGS